MTGDPPTRVVVWFSCGAASAVAAKLLIERCALHPEKYEVVIARCMIPEEHEDNDRFAAECALWFGQPVLELSSTIYESAVDVWTRRRYMAGVKGAPCTDQLKREVRKAFQRDWMPDLQVFGFTAEESARADRFRKENPEMGLVCNLIDAGITKDACFDIITAAGIQLPAMYSLGFRNNNCIGCVKASSPVYWQRVREHFPEVFQQRAQLSREIGARLIKTTKKPRTRMFLDELPDVPQSGREPDIECSILCVLEGEM